MSGESENKPLNFSVEAIYQDGCLKPKTPLLLPDGAAVHVTVTSLCADPLESVIGIGEGAEDGADCHNRYIYGKPRQ